MKMNSWFKKSIAILVMVVAGVTVLFSETIEQDTIEIKGALKVGDGYYFGRISTFLSEDEVGPGNFGLYSLRNGSSNKDTGGVSFTFYEMSAAMLGYSYWGNEYSAGVAGYSNLNYPYSAAVIGADAFGYPCGMLGYKDENSKKWAGYFMGNVNIRGNSELSSVSATSLSADQVSVAGSITGDDITIDGNVVVGDIGSPAGKVAIKQGHGHWLTLFRSNGDYWSIHNPSEEDRLSFGLVKTDGSAQWGLLTLHDNGNVGIGATNGANEKLAVGGNVRIDGEVTTQERVSINKGWGNWLQLHTTNDNGYWRFHNPENQDKLMLGLRDGDGNEHWDFFVINENGNIGISATNGPNDKLAVGGDTRIEGKVTTQERISINKGWGNWLQLHTTNGNGYWRFHNPENQDKLMLGLHDHDGVDHWDYFVIHKNGNVGIGTNNPGTNRLAVEGTIGCRELRVTPDAWADYVFSNTYNLKPLEEIEKHIKDNGHLEGIPSESEVKKNGVSLGSMQIKLLEKIEEITLHMIEMKKEYNGIKEENEKLKRKIRELEMTLVK